MILSDSDLISRVLARDDRYAFSQLVRKYQSPVRLFLRRLLKGNLEIAEDLSQETFLTAYKKLGTFQGRASFSSWLFAIARNSFLMHIRGKKIEFAWDVQDEEAEYKSTSDTKLDLEAAISQLKPIERAAISMCYCEELTHPEVAEILEIPLGTLKTHVNRGRDKLKAILSDAGGA